VCAEKAEPELSPQRRRELAAFIASGYQPLVEALARNIEKAPVKLDPFDTERASTLPRVIPDGAPPAPAVQLLSAARLVPSRDLAGVAKVPAVYTQDQTYPVGQYGARFAWRLAEAEALWYEVVQQLPVSDLGARLESQGVKSVHDPGATVYFGLLSILLAGAQFTAYRVNGFDNPYDLLRAIPTREFVEFGARCPVAVLGPMCMNSLFFPLPVLRVCGSGAVMSHELRTLLLEEQRIYWRDLQLPKEKQQVKRTYIHTTRGRGCPVDFEPLVKPLIGWVLRRELAIRQGQIRETFHAHKPVARAVAL